MNDLFKQMEYAFFQDDPAAGLQFATALVHQLDFDDDDDGELLLRVLEQCVFRAGQTALLDTLESLSFDFGARWPKKGGLMPACVAGGCRDASVMECLTAHGASPYDTDGHGRNILHLAACRQKPAWGEGPGPLAAQLAAAYDVSRLMQSDYAGATPLHYAVLYGHNDMTAAFLSAGANPNATGTVSSGTLSFVIGFDGLTPLHLAAWMGNLASADCLLESGADPFVVDRDGRTPAHYIAEIPPIALEPAFHGSIPAKQAVCDRKAAILEKLNSVDTADDQGNTPLHALIACRDYPLSSLAVGCIARGANATAANYRGMTPLMLAAEAGRQELVKPLVAAGVPLDPRNTNGDTALHLAVCAGHDKTARYLLKKSADAHIVNNSGVSPAAMAASKGLSEVLSLIID